jgi:hypothetical protein
MFSTLFSLLSCASDSDKTPFFPQTNNTELGVKKLILPTNQMAVSYIVSKNKKQLLVHSIEHENENTHHPTADSHLLVFDQNGTLQQDVPMNIDVNNDNYTLFYANQGQLTMNNLAYLHFIDPKTFQKASYFLYKSTHYPNWKANGEKARKESESWEQGEIENLKSKYNYQNEEIRVANKTISDAFWKEYRAIKSQTESKAFEIEEKYYRDYMSALTKNSSTFNGVVIGKTQYILLKSADNEALYAVDEHFRGKVNWIVLERNTQSLNKNEDSPLIFENDFVEDNKAKFTCLEKIHTSSIKDDFTGKVANDYVIKIESPTKNATFRMKNNPLRLADDRFFTLENGTSVVEYAGNIYLIN